jgi:hypothetical protein
VEQCEIVGMRAPELIQVDGNCFARASAKAGILEEAAHRLVSGSCSEIQCDWRAGLFAEPRKKGVLEASLEHATRHDE